MTPMSPLTTQSFVSVCTSIVYGIHPSRTNLFFFLLKFEVAPSFSRPLAQPQHPPFKYLSFQTPSQSFLIVEALEPRETRNNEPSPSLAIVVFFVISIFITLSQLFNARPWRK
jgi:hypothetical protein